MPVLESKLIIGATDETQAAFASVMARINELQARISQVNVAVPGALPRAIPAPSRATQAATALAAPAAATAARTSAAVKAAAAAGAGSSIGDMVGAAATFIPVVSQLMSGWREAMAQQHERMRQEVAAMSSEEIAKGEQLAAAIAAKYPSVPQSEIMHSLRTARTVTGSFEEAENVIDPLTRLRVIAQAANPQASIEEMREEFDKLVKALEIAGVATDPKRLGAYVNDVAKSLNAFGDQLKPSDYFEMLKYARQAAPGLSERFLMTTLATFGTEIGGASAGTAAASFNQTLLSGNPRYFTHTGAMTLHELGLVSDEDLARTRTGEIKGIKPFHHMKDWRLARSDPDLWITQDLLPAIHAKFGDDKDAVATVIGQVFNNRNAANLALQIATQQMKFGKNADLWGQAQGLAAANVLASKDAATALSGATNAVTRAVADNIPTDLIGRLASAAGGAAGWFAEHVMPPPFHPSERLGQDLQSDLKGWKDLFDSISIGRPTWESSEDWHADMRATGALWGAGYRAADLSQEMAREHARAVAASPLAFRGASDWEGRTGALSIPVIAPAASQAIPAPQQVAQAAGPQEVNVSGQATVEHSVHVEVTLDPVLRAKIDQLTNSTEFTVPLIGGGTGRMDSDAAPHRGGIGSM